MYEYIKGSVAFVGPEYIVIENGGIGFQILTPNPFVFAKYEQQTVTVYVYQHVREDVLALYGFISIEEKRLFEKLISVSGIGPKGALAVLASGEPQQVVSAIEQEDEKFLTKFPGVGKKTARQMILDLKGKLADVVPEFFPNLFHPDGMGQKPAACAELEEALLALEALGYSAKEIKRISKKLQAEQLTTDQYIRKGLQLLLNG
ncbi:Holliday junction branch migration protein RuvA [Bacillus badius]|uniref:Holliday junction branch migration protein RuvA n=1 Tax=Bacillus badius TaxID=1455 RepID=UPI0005972809|nr:Holliday junction branch migration protein RuvA [Bacillus badius]KZN98709.1 Holliday junction DNA helicase RuvA [Bacillus badius]KZR58399.1 Holliday junction DNA helicase RuvA [Bacillus badius]MED0666302.1 Holliday junction branch migration protein RuvA [Bacillus badius]MED4716419.1 Holliday junction branch migration protein RuvA [Bacillus badius]OCS83647.1 Holliday junction DNA helicase RuvA [Bacillus badius]